MPGIFSNGKHGALWLFIGLAGLPYHPPLDEACRGEAALRDGFPARLHRECFNSFSSISSEIRGYFILVSSLTILHMMPLIDPFS